MTIAKFRRRFSAIPEEKGEIQPHTQIYLADFIENWVRPAGISRGWYIKPPSILDINIAPCTSIALFSSSSLSALLAPSRAPPAEAPASRATNVAEV